MNKKTFILIIVFLVLSSLFSKTIFRRNFVLPEEKGLFSQEVQEEVKKRVKPKQEIYVSGLSMYESSFSIGLLSPTSNPRVLNYWYIIYNNSPKFMEENRNHAYKLYKSGTVQDIAVTGLKTMPEMFADLQRLWKNYTAITQAINGGKAPEGAWYDIRMNENGGKPDQYLIKRVTATVGGKSTYEDEMANATDSTALEGVRYFTLGDTLEEQEFSGLKPEQGLYMVYEGDTGGENQEILTLKAVLKLTD